MEPRPTNPIRVTSVPPDTPVIARSASGTTRSADGSSRAKTFSTITEPVVLFVVFTVALLAGADLPYALAATVRSNGRQIIRPAYLLPSVTLFMMICTRRAGSWCRRTPGPTSAA